MEQSVDVGGRGAAARPRRRSASARIEQATAPPSVEDQGSRSDHSCRSAPSAGPVAQVANSRFAGTIRLGPASVSTRDFAEPRDVGEFVPDRLLCEALKCKDREFGSGSRPMQEALVVIARGSCRSIMGRARCRLLLGCCRRSARGAFRAQSERTGLAISLRRCQPSSSIRPLVRSGAPSTVSVVTAN